MCVECRVRSQRESARRDALASTSAAKLHFSSKSNAKRHLELLCPGPGGSCRCGVWGNEVTDDAFCKGLGRTRSCSTWAPCSLGCARLVDLMQILLAEGSAGSGGEKGQRSIWINVLLGWRDARTSGGCCSFKVGAEGLSRAGRGGWRCGLCSLLSAH